MKTDWSLNKAKRTPSGVLFFVKGFPSNRKVAWGSLLNKNLKRCIYYP